MLLIEDNFIYHIWHCGEFDTIRTLYQVLYKCNSLLHKLWQLMTDKYLKTYTYIYTFSNTHIAPYERPC